MKDCREVLMAYCDSVPTANSNLDLRGRGTESCAGAV